MLVATDVAKIFLKIWQTEATRKIFRENICRIENREKIRPADTMFNFAADDFTVLSRSQIRSLTLVDLFRTKEELKIEKKSGLL